MDDFGIVGCKDGNANPGELSPVEFACLGARQLLKSAGFDVHKEDFGRSGELIGGQFVDSWLLPHQRKVWSAVARSRAARRANKVPPSFVETIVATFSWYFLIERAALSIFDVVYRFCKENRDKKAMKLPTAVLRELAKAEAIVPLLGVNLGAAWNEKVYLFDASTVGIKTYWRHIETDRNHLDGPSRVGPLGVMAKARAEMAVRGPPTWIDAAHAEFENIVDNATSPSPSTITSSSTCPAVDQLPRIRAPKIPLYRFLHLYSGHRREGDLEDEITRAIVAEGAMCLVTLVDLGFGNQHDLTQRENLDRYLAQARVQFYDGVHAGPPCAL